MFSYILVLPGSARPVLPWQQGLVQHGEDYGGRQERKKREGRARLQSPTSTRNPPGVGSGRDADTTVQAQLLFSGKHLCPSASSLVFLHLHVFSPFSAHLAHAPFLIFTPRRVFPSIFVLPTFVVLFFPPLLFFMSLLPFSPPSSLRVN